MRRMNIRQLAFVNLLAKWTKGSLVDASYSVIGKELGITSVAAFLRVKTLERQGWVKRRTGKLYLHPQFCDGSLEAWNDLG